MRRLTELRCAALALALLLGIARGGILPVKRLVASCRAGGAGLQPDTCALGDMTGMVLRATFSRDATRRAYWDFPLEQTPDLRQMAAVRLRYRCADASGASQFNLYIKAENAWYAAPFSPLADGQWHEEIIPKTLFKPENAPASWLHCKTLRLAAWRGQARDVVLQIAALELANPNVSVAILRSWKDAGKGREAYTYASHLGNALLQGGILPAVIEDDDCAERLLSPYKLLLMPLPDAASPNQLNAVHNYVRQGGHIGAFHSIPPLLASTLNFPVGKFLRAADLPATPATVVPDRRRLPQAEPFRQESGALLAVTPVGKDMHVNAWWHDSQGKTLGHPAILENSTGFWMTHVFLNQDPQPAARTLLVQLERFAPAILQTSAGQLLAQARFNLANARKIPQKRQERARQFLKNAEKLYTSRQFLPAADFARKSDRALTEIEAEDTTSHAPLFRAVWLRNPLGVAGHAWRDQTSRLRKAGFVAVFPRLGDATGLSSDISACLDGCQAAGLQAHIWLHCLSVEDCAPAVRQAFSRQELLQRDFQNRELNWLCPSRPANRQRLVRLAAAAAADSRVKGLHLDFIRYPSSQACLCQACRDGFEAILGHPVANWPVDVMPGHPHHDAWLDFRREAITSLVRDMAAAARSRHPGIVISAAVFPDPAGALRTVGQDWPSWLQTGAAAFVCPMNYYASTSESVAAFLRQAERTGRPRQLLPGIGVTSLRLDATETQNQINALQQAGAPGFILFEGNAHLLLDIIPKLH